VPSEWQPFAKLAVQDHQHLPILNDEEGNGEIDFLVEMRHGWKGGCRPGVDGMKPIELGLF
jgi:hypothetical protein